MGYYMHQTDSNFRIKAEHMGLLYLRLKQLEAGRWVSQSTIDTAATVEEILREWRWAPRFDAQLNMVDIWFDSEKSGDDDLLFNVLAEFVEADSYIEMRGEDDAHWRFWFTGSECHEITPHITWPDMEK
jgi:hypothetical protein